MFIDYITLMLTNMTAGLVLLAGFVLIGLGRENLKPWAPSFLIVALVALVTGFSMTLTWPIPIPAYHPAFGEMTVLFGAAFLGAALALARGTSLTAVAVYGLIASAAPVLIGIRGLQLSYFQVAFTARPDVSCTGFILTGLGGAMVLLSLTRNRAVRVINAIVLLAAAGIWALVAGMGYWAHLEMWMKQT